MDWQPVRVSLTSRPIAPGEISSSRPSLGKVVQVFVQKLTPCAALFIPLSIYVAYKWKQRKKNALEDDENCKTGGRKNDSHENQHQAERKLKQKEEELKETKERLKETTERLKETTERLKETNEELKETTERLKDATERLDEMTWKYDKQQEETEHTLVIEELKETQQVLESKISEIRTLQKELQQVTFHCEFVTDKKEQLDAKLTELKDQNQQELKTKIQDEQLKRKEVEEEMEVLKKELENMKKKLKEVPAEAEVVPELEIPGEHLQVPTEQKETRFQEEKQPETTRGESLEAENSD